MWSSLRRQPSRPASILLQTEDFFVQSASSAFLLSASLLSASLISAYRETEYRVTQGRPFVLRIDEPCAQLSGLYKATHHACAAFITACNPFSRSVSDAENTQRQIELSKELRGRSLMFLEGVGQHPSGDWPGEPSFLVMGLSLEAAKTLGNSFEQNAIVWCGADAVPNLVLLR